MEFCKEMRNVMMLMLSITMGATLHVELNRIIFGKLKISNKEKVFVNVDTSPCILTVYPLPNYS